MNTNASQHPPAGIPPENQPTNAEIVHQLLMQSASRGANPDELLEILKELDAKIDQETAEARAELVNNNVRLVRSVSLEAPDVQRFVDDHLTPFVGTIADPNARTPPGIVTLLLMTAASIYHQTQSARRTEPVDLEGELGCILTGIQHGINFK